MRSCSPTQQQGDPLQRRQGDPHEGDRSTSSSKAAAARGSFAAALGSSVSTPHKCLGTATSSNAVGAGTGVAARILRRHEGVPLQPATVSALEEPPCTSTARQPGGSSGDRIAHPAARVPELDAFEDDASAASSPPMRPSQSLPALRCTGVPSSLRLVRVQGLSQQGGLKGASRSRLLSDENDDPCLHTHGIRIDVSCCAPSAHTRSESPPQPPPQRSIMGLMREVARSSLNFLLYD